MLIASHKYFSDLGINTKKGGGGIMYPQPLGHGCK